MMQTMKPYSEDLRRRIVRAVRGGIPKSSAACVFGVSLSSVKRYFRIAKQGASLAPRKGGGRPPKTNETVEKLLEDDVEKRPEVTVSERWRFLECATTGAVFEVYTEKVLLSSLRRGQVMVMDNLSAHKGQRVRELIESVGCELLYLPPYFSSDFRPIEEAFSKAKGLLRKAEARGREALIKTMGKALEAVTTKDAKGFFEHCGYYALGQPF
jgi:transposase